MNTVLKSGIFALLMVGLLSLSGCGDSGKPAFADAPDWMPKFPNVKPELINKEKKKDGSEEVIYYFTTDKSPKEMVDFYAAGFEKAGFDKTKFEGKPIDEDGNKQENLKSDDGKRVFNFSARLEKGAKETQVNVVVITKGSSGDAGTGNKDAKAPETPKGKN